ncbi:hypothetical protein [Clostridium luticellarii]|jgi:hypothetical protein|uniref:hypothetical protein n=1 Tax=Clostridium luticellarii TaxID=1691940 RepID=UPI002352E7FA|nr:hypothetical protein [Clostridium luticellarii]MCI1944429.1 hypothetical protein [Clostridium luticellarii]MCI1967928.1 hypothetical protein [Clostridium luticellarii]
MNKIKFVYDLLGTIKQKENIKGSLNMTGVKGNTKVFEMNNNNGFHIHYSNDLHFHNDSTPNHENKLNKIKFLFGMLNHIKIEKKPESGYTLSLISDKISEDLQELLFEVIDNNIKNIKVENNYIHNNYSTHLKHDNFHKDLSFEKRPDEFHNFMKQLHKSKNFKFQIEVSVNDKYEVKKSTVKIESPQFNMKLNVNVNLS